MNGGFAPGIGEKLHSYVYLLVDPRTGRAFFAGRGRNDRCFRHVQAARSAVDSTADRREDGQPAPDHEHGEVAERGEGADRGFPVLERIREIESNGRSVRVDILRHGLNADEARLVEAVARDALGLRSVPDAGATGPTGSRRALPAQRIEASTLNAQLAKPAKIKPSHPVVLLRLGKSLGPGPSDAELDDAVRSGWKIGRRWTDPRSPRSPQWAFAVVDDVVRAVFRIDGWKLAEPAIRTSPSQPTRPPAPGAPPRWALAGERDPELERKYRGRNVSAYLSPGSQNPVTYVWCGPHWVNRPV
ncbi:MAG TPA: hypothetical protein VIX85_08680 [Acidimicrobiales bacterium]